MNRSRSLSLLLSVILTAALYGRAIYLPFFFDDLDHMPFVAATGLLDIWGSSGGFPYYRPLGATIWRFFFQLLNENNPLVLHAFNLILHITNGTLIALIVAKFSQNNERLRWAAPLAAAFFIVFPFSYQAVPWIGAVYHLLAASLILIAVYATISRVDHPSNAYLLLGIGAAFLAPFAHENGVVLPLLLPLAAFLFRPSRFKINLTSLSIWTAPTAAWLIIWLLVPKGRSDGFFPINFEAVWQNTVYFLQGLTFPTTIFTGRLVSQGGWHDFTTTYLFAAVGILLIVIGYQTAKKQLQRIILFGLGWFVVSSLPAVFLLDFAYILSSPRLLMIPSVGVAIVWAGVICALWESVRYKAILRAFSIGLAGYILAASSWMIVVHMNQHETLGRIWQQAADITVEANRPGFDTVPVFVNLPSALVERQLFFPIGHEGTVFMVPYIPLERIIDGQLGHPASAVFRAYEDIRPQRDYLYDVLDSGRDWPEILAGNPRVDIWLTDYLEDDIQLRRIGSSITPTRPTFPFVFAELDSSILLASAVQEKQNVAVEIVWRVGETAPPFEWTAFVHLLDDQGQLITQADGHPWGNTYPLGQWSPAAQHIDLRTITIPEGATGELTVQIGLYSNLSGERATVILPDGETADALKVSVTEK